HVLFHVRLKELALVLQLGPAPDRVIAGAKEKLVDRIIAGDPARRAERMRHPEGALIAGEYPGFLVIQQEDVADIADAGALRLKQSRPLASLPDVNLTGAAGDGNRVAQRAERS